MSDLAKLRWRCRRGMRELDALMLAWLNTHYESADATARMKFEELLAMQDPDILTLLKQYDDPAVDHADENRTSKKQPNIKPISSKDSSFENIIRQAREAARDAARDTAKEAARETSRQAARDAAGE